MAKDYEIVRGDDGYTAQVSIRGRAVLRTPMINCGTAFTEEQRDGLGLTGMLPPAVLTIDDQLRRVYSQLQGQPTDLAKFIFLNDLQDRNEVLFYKLLNEHLVELLPIVYTPTIGEAIQKYSQWFLRPRGIFLDIDHPEDIEASLRAFGNDPEDIDLIVATDSEGILGIGDQGVGGVLVCVGKLAVYTAAAGIHPNKVLSVVLDTGTNNRELLDDPGYLGLRHERVRGQRYDDFIEAYVTTASRIFPNAILHWEDFAAGNSHRIVNHYRRDYCTFNDDIQGTAAVVAGAVLSGVATAGTELVDQKIVIQGCGTAGIGISNLLYDMLVKAGLSSDEAYRRFYGVDINGLLVRGDDMRDFQQPYARAREDVADWVLVDPAKITLTDVVKNVNPTIMIGTSAQAGAFTQEIIEHVAANCERPIIMPLSNPTLKAEATPKNVITWSKGKALVSTGSPFAPVDFEGTTFYIGQGNNALVFPGLGLGVIACRARLITDDMIAAAAATVANLVTDRSLGASLLPSVSKLWEISKQVAEDVVRAAVADGVARVGLDEGMAAVEANMWRPEYPKFDLV